MINILNSIPLYLICGSIIAFVALICIIFIIRAYRAGKAIGMDTAVLKNAITGSAAFSLLPSIGILLGVIALSGSLGTPWAWLRLSVIGALHYETQVAEAASEAVGMGNLSIENMTPKGFATIALLMSVCIMWGMILSVIFNKKYLKKIGGNKTEAKEGFGNYAMTAMFIGLISAYMGSYIGEAVSGAGLFSFTGDYIPLIVAIISALAMALFILIAEKKKAAFLDNFSIAGSMLIGMSAAAIINLFI